MLGLVQMSLGGSVLILVILLVRSLGKISPGQIRPAALMGRRRSAPAAALDDCSALQRLQWHPRDPNRFA
jgi:hypothetical protein